MKPTYVLSLPYIYICRCGPCRGYTPILVSTYKAVQAAGKAFEVVLIGSDRTKADFEKYHKEMPWLALPFDNRYVSNIRNS